MACSTKTPEAGEPACRPPLTEVLRERDRQPVFHGVLRYFPKALRALAEVSRIGNEQHNKGEPLHWAREKSTDELGALVNHLMHVAAGIETDEEDGMLHAAKIAWRALANLEKTLEQRGGQRGRD